MYQAFYGLEQMPFEASADPSWFIDTPGRQGALDALADQVRRRSGVITLEGWVGAGKTELLRAYERSIDPDRVKVGWVTRADFDELDLLATLGTMLAGEAGEPLAPQEIPRRLRERAAAGQATVLLVDNTETMTDMALRALGDIADLPGGDAALVSIVLAVRPPFVALFARPAAAALDRHASVRVRLPLLTPGEARALIEHRLRRAGATDPYSVLSPEAVEAIVIEAGGVPRRLLSLAERVLEAGCRTRRVLVDFATAELAIRGGEIAGAGPSAPFGSARLDAQPAAPRVRAPITLDPPRRPVSAPPPSRPPARRDTGRQLIDAVSAVAVPAALIVVAVGVGYWLWALSDDNSAPAPAPTMAEVAPPPEPAKPPPSPISQPAVAPAAAPAAQPAPQAPTRVDLMFLPARRGDTLRTLYRAAYRTPRYRPPFEALMAANPNLAPDRPLTAGELVALPGPLIDR